MRFPFLGLDLKSRVHTWYLGVFDFCVLVDDSEWCYGLFSDIKTFMNLLIVWVLRKMAVGVYFGFLVMFDLGRMVFLEVCFELGLVSLI